MSGGGAYTEAKALQSNRERCRTHCRRRRRTRAPPPPRAPPPFQEPAAAPAAAPHATARPPRTHATAPPPRARRAPTPLLRLCLFRWSSVLERAVALVCRNAKASSHQDLTAKTGGHRVHLSLRFGILIA